MDFNNTINNIHFQKSVLPTKEMQN